jgi:hypothetical protein
MRNHSLLLALLLLPVAGQSRPEPQVQAAADAVITKTDQARSVIADAKRAALNIDNDFQRGLVLDQIGATEAKTGNFSWPEGTRAADRCCPLAGPNCEGVPPP